MSFLAKELKNNAKLLRKGAENQISDIQKFKTKISHAAPHFKQFFICEKDIDPETVITNLHETIQATEIPFTAIDGTMFKTSVMDASIFFAGSYESSGFIKLQKKSLDIAYTHKYTNRGRGISSVIPLQVADIVEVDTQFDLDILRSDYGIQISEDIILDQSNIAESIMLFSEYYLAYKSLLRNIEYPTQVLLLDRTLAGDHSALIARTQKQILWKKTVNLLGYQVKGFEDSPVNEKDYYWGRWYFTDNTDPIRPYFRFKILKLLKQAQQPMSYNDIVVKLQLERVLRSHLISELKLLERKGYIIHLHKSFVLKPEVKQSWEKLHALVLEIGERIFQTDVDSLETKSPFLIKNKNNQEKWITTRDLHFLTLFCMYMIMELAYKKNFLVLGMTKDSGAREFRRQVVPILIAQGLFSDIKIGNILKIPHSDRSFLENISATNLGESIPWILKEYDAVYRTIMIDGKKVIGTKSNLTGIMLMFAKSYVQLKRSKKDHELQSHVLAIDRILTKVDIQKRANIQELLFKKNEKDPINYKLNTYISQGFYEPWILLLLHAMMPESLPDAFGHNKPLYIADKVAKFYVNEFKRLLSSIGSWITNDNHNKEKNYYQSFRETRNEIEQNRYLETT